MYEKIRDFVGDHPWIIILMIVVTTAIVCLYPEMKQTVRHVQEAQSAADAVMTK